MTIVEFSVTSPLIGGALIGLSATLLLWLNGNISGISGITFSLLESVTKLNIGQRVNMWRLLFVVGLVVGAALYHQLLGIPAPQFPDTPLPIIVAGGLLVGLGTKIGSGCTSGHGVCGIACFSNRSIISTVTYMGFGVISVWVFRHLLGLI